MSKGRFGGLIKTTFNFMSQSQPDKDAEKVFGKIYAANLADASKPALSVADRAEFGRLVSEAL